MKKALLIFLIAATIITLITYFYLYKGHRDVAETEATSSYTAAALLAVFQDEDLENDKQALDQVINVTGTVSAQQDSLLTLENAVFIQMQKPVKVKLNNQVTVKGRCLGYDGLLQEIKIDQAIILKNEL
jgi:hypothetical protein